MHQVLITPLILLFFVAGCTEQRRDNTKDKTRNNEPSANEPTTIAQINKEAEKIPNIRSLIFSKDEKILSEKYFRPYSSDSLDHVRSVTKSVTALLVGIAIDQGLIESVDQPISDFLGKKYPKYKSKLDQITIYHLLTMSAGFEWDESTVTEFNQWVVSGDPVRYVLNRKLKHKPGEKWEYNSAGSHLLSVILTEASGMSTLDFANRYLFEPLEIRNIRWDRISGYYNGGAGLQLRPINMHAIGIMMNNHGMFKGKQVVPGSWVDEATKWHKKVGGSTGYGFLWWVDNDPDIRVAFAIGHAGQFIVILPDLKVVMTASCNWQSLGGKASFQEGKVAELMKNEIYPYLKNLNSQATTSN